MNAMITPGDRTAMLLSIVALAFGVAPRVIRAPGRRLPATHARHVAVGLMKHGVPDPAKVTLPWLGKYFCRDHTTILYALRRYAAWCAALDLPLAFDSPGERAAAIAGHLGYAPPAIPDATAPEMEPSMSDVQRSVPSSAWIGTLFGDFEMSLADFDALPEPMQAEGLRLAIEKAGAESLEERYAVGRTIGLSTQRVLRLLTEKTLRAMPDETAARHAAAVDVPRAAAEEFKADPGDGFDRFAKACLQAQAGGTLAVSAAYAVYVDFCRANLFDPLPRTNFGAGLKRIAGRGQRQGDLQAGVSLRLEQQA